MEDELRCPTCKQLYANPVLLPCFHALCLGCALDIQSPYTTGAIQASVTSASNCLGGNLNASCTLHTVTRTVLSQPSSIQHQQQQQINGNQQQQSTHAHIFAHSQQHNHNHHSILPSHIHTHQHSNPPATSSTRHSSNSSAASTASSATGSESMNSDQDQSDKVSILSEADSGVCCSNTSRPVSYAGSGGGGISSTVHGALLHGPSASAPPGAAYSLTCPLCRKIVFFDEGGVRNLPPYRTMESIVDRFFAREALRCQMCETDPKVASLLCEQCEIRYCDSCRELCHPARGPLAKHTLVKPNGSSPQRESVCEEHEQLLSMYCVSCKLPACAACINDQRHPQHEVQPITATCKAQKVSVQKIL